MMHDALSMVRLRGEVRAVKSRKRLIFVLLCTVLCLFLYAFAFAEGYTLKTCNFQSLTLFNDFNISRCFCQ